MTGSFHAAHAVIDGKVDKIIFNMSAQMAAPHASTFGPRPPGGRALAVAGRVFAEHVLTRLFAPAGERKVTRLDLPSMPAVPPDVVAWRTPAAILDLPEGAEPIEADFRGGSAAGRLRPRSHRLQPARQLAHLPAHVRGGLGPPLRRARQEPGGARALPRGRLPQAELRGRAAAHRAPRLHARLAPRRRGRVRHRGRGDARARPDEAALRHQDAVPEA